jgi:hypothetical protein
MAAWATRIVFVAAMLLPIVVGLWLYSVVLAAPLGTFFPQTSRTPVPPLTEALTGSSPTAVSTSVAAPVSATAPLFVAETPRPAATAQLTPTPSAQRTPVPSQQSGQRSEPGPIETVQAFYRHIGQGEFDAAAALWTEDMKRRHPPDENIRRRFSQTWSIRLEDASLASLSADGNQASVAVQVVEVQGSPPAPQRFSGTWWLTRGANVWLMDRPSLERR